jgi:hypothetical protein
VQRPGVAMSDAFVAGGVVGVESTHPTEMPPRPRCSSWIRYREGMPGRHCPVDQTTTGSGCRRTRSRSCEDATGSAPTRLPVVPQTGRYVAVHSGQQSDTRGEGEVVSEEFYVSERCSERINPDHPTTIKANSLIKSVSLTRLRRSQARGSCSTGLAH